MSKACPLQEQSTHHHGPRASSMAGAASGAESLGAQPSKVRLCISLSGIVTSGPGKAAVAESLTSVCCLLLGWQIFLEGPESKYGPCHPFAVVSSRKSSHGGHRRSQGGPEPARLAEMVVPGGRRRVPLRRASVPSSHWDSRASHGAGREGNHPDPGTRQVRVLAVWVKTAPFLVPSRPSAGR